VTTSTETSLESASLDVTGPRIGDDGVPKVLLSGKVENGSNADDTSGVDDGFEPPRVRVPVKPLGNTGPGESVYVIVTGHSVSEVTVLAPEGLNGGPTVTVTGVGAGT